MRKEYLDLEPHCAFITGDHAQAVDELYQTNNNQASSLDYSFLRPSPDKK